MTTSMVIATSSSALFNLTEEDRLFREKGTQAYSEHQIAKENEPLGKGYAFNLIEKFLRLNTLGLGPLVEVVLLSKNSADTGLRVMNSIEHYNLNMVRAAFCGGSNPYVYAKAFDASLFLSANEADVRQALNSGVPSAAIITGGAGSSGGEIRLALDGDAVLFSDKGELLYQEKGLDAFNENEKRCAQEPMEGGPLRPFLEVIHKLQRQFEDGSCPIRTALVTARSAPAHERVIRTLRSWDVRLDEMLFLGGRDKASFVKAFNADIFFDDQMKHIASVGNHIASAHVPNGVMNAQ